MYLFFEFASLIWAGSGTIQVSVSAPSGFRVGSGWVPDGLWVGSGSSFYLNTNTNRCHVMTTENCLNKSSLGFIKK
jgi:hypothetical protein